MPNKNYIAGRAFEYYIKKQWESEGYVMLRTAGSHGFADLVAISPTLGLVTFIQCKVVKTDAEAKRLQAEWKDNIPLPQLIGKLAQVLLVKIKGARKITIIETSI